MASTVYDAILGALTLKQVTRSDFQPNAQQIAGKASGAVAPSELFAGAAEPVISFDSMDVSGVLAAISISAGLAVSSGTITVPWNKRANGGTFASGTAHDELNATDGLIVPTSFSANQGDEGASVSLDVHLISSDGATVPVTAAGSQSLASQSFNAMYSLGAGSINGTAIPELVGVSINPGIQVEKQSIDGFNYPTAVFINSVDPYIDFIFEDMDAVATYAPLFTVGSAAIAYFRKRSGVSFVADGTAQHCKFSFADGLVVAQGIQHSGINRGQATLRVYGEALTASGASAIT